MIWVKITRFSLRSEGISDEIARVSEMQGEDEEWLQSIAGDMEPEDSCLQDVGTDETTTTAFTPFGSESLKELTPMDRPKDSER